MGQHTHLFEYGGLNICTPHRQRLSRDQEPKGTAEGANERPAAKAHMKTHQSESGSLRLQTPPPLIPHAKLRQQPPGGELRPEAVLEVEEPAADVPVLCFTRGKEPPSGIKGPQGPSVVFTAPVKLCEVLKEAPHLY